VPSPSAHLLPCNRAIFPFVNGGDRIIESLSTHNIMTAMHSTCTNDAMCSPHGTCLLPTEHPPRNCINYITPGAGVTLPQATPPNIGRSAVSRVQSNSVVIVAPPTEAATNPAPTCTFSDQMAGHSDTHCYCTICEPDSLHTSPSCTTEAAFQATSPSALHTGWPLADFTPLTDDLISNCLRIYDNVRASGAPNFLLAKIPLPHQLNIERWRAYLYGHTDLALVDFLQYGFPVGFISSNPLESSIRNHASALLNPTHIQKYLDKEVACQAILGPFDHAPFWPWCHLNPLMTRPKKDCQDRRVILDLSWPINASVNAGTPLEVYMDEPYKLALPTVDDFAQILAFQGPGSFMWTLDLRRAYRQIRIDPLDWPLICFSWEGNFYVNISVAFGVRHGASFAQRLSQAVCDILAQEQIVTIPYIDDFIGSQPTEHRAWAHYDRSLRLFAELGLDLNPSKCISPTTTLNWIGVTYDSLTMTMSIPTKVIEETKALVTSWLDKARATRHDLQVLLGKLFHAGKCCPAARLFVGRMLDTLRAAPPSGYTTLPHNFRLDLRWWRDFLPHYNGRQLIQLNRPAYHVHMDIHDPTISIYTLTHSTTATIPDSVATSDHRWANRELYAVLVALLLWGKLWADAEVMVHCRETAKLQVLVHGRSRNDAILEISRRIWRVTAMFDIRLSPAPFELRPSSCTIIIPPPEVDLN
jgi:hypothetical protein